eukprot:scaffold300753_cov28-Tisochrysis_lutea.AAC.4
MTLETHAILLHAAFRAPSASPLSMNTLRGVRMTTRPSTPWTRSHPRGFGMPSASSPSVGPQRPKPHVNEKGSLGSETDFGGRKTRPSARPFRTTSCGRSLCLGSMLRWANGFTGGPPGPLAAVCLKQAKLLARCRLRSSSPSPLLSKAHH